MMQTLEFSEFILNLEKLPVGVSEGGVIGLSNARRLFVPFLKDKQVEYFALKAHPSEVARNQATN